jgi:hypothetical protein
MNPLRGPQRQGELHRLFILELCCSRFIQVYEVIFTGADKRKGTWTEITAA